MERLDGAVRGALRGAGVPDAGALADVTRLWPAVVGDAIARASWPQRISRDGTLQVAAASSTWAFELGLLADQILAKLAAEIGSGAPTAIRFAPGPVPAPPAPLPSETPVGAARDRRRDPAAGRGAHLRDERRGAARDDRESGRREPRQGRFQPPFLIHCDEPRKARFAGLFSLREVIYAA